MTSRRVAAVALALAVLAARVRAADDQAADGKPADAKAADAKPADTKADDAKTASAPDTGYDLSSTVTAGYRNADIDGSKDKYKEDYNLRSGGRLFTFAADGVAHDPANAPVDRFSLIVDHPGDEPVSTFHLSADDERNWDFRANFVRSKYFYSVPQLFENPVPGDVRLDDLHVFDQIRTDGSVDFRLHRDGLPTIFVGYRLYQIEGAAISTVFDANGGDTFLVQAPSDTRAHVGRIGTEFKALGTDVSVTQEYRELIRDIGLHGPDVGAANGLDPNDGVTLTRYNSAGSEHVGSPTTIVRLRRPIGDALELNGLYLYSHANLDADWTTHEATDVGGTTTDQGRLRHGSATLDTNIADMGATYRVTDRWRFHLSYRFDERSQHGDLDQQDTGSGAAFFSLGTGDHVRLNRTTLDTEIEPRSDLFLRFGLRYAWRDANISTGVGDVSTQTLGAIADVRYRPWSILDLFVRYESAQVDDPYFSAGDASGRPVIPGREIELTFVNRGSAGATIRPWSWLRVAYRFIADSRENASFDARDFAVGNSGTVVLTPLPSLTLSTSYARRDLTDSADILIAPTYAKTTSLQAGSEDILASQLAYDFGLLGQRWSTGWNVYWVNSEQVLRPRLETSGGARTHYDLSRIDAGAFLSWHHPWVEPGIAVRRIEYTEPQLPRNDYDATIVEITLTRRFGTTLP